MTHHTDDVQTSGAGAEAWLLRLILASVLSVLAVALVGSWSDIQRYLRMRQM
jgi:hypothetical protein